MDKGNFVIVIGRQYGSGGRKLGKYLAEALGVDYYDKELLSRAAEQIGYSPDLFARADERRPSILRSLLTLNYGAHGNAGDDSCMSSESLYSYQSEVIRKICEQGSCVIVGRTADYVMRDHPRMLSIFIHAPLSYRAEMIMKRENAASKEEAAEMARKADKNRESYYNYFTNRHWGHADNYHLSIDSTRINEKMLLDIVKDSLGIS